MRALIGCMLFIFSCFPSLFAQKSSYVQSFQNPLHLSFSFSGTFGELRPSHFHTGLDIRTQGRTGLPVYAAKDGYISRISVSPTGYGNSLYIRHPDGLTTVYGHLQRFTSSISEYVKEYQYNYENYQVNLILSPQKFIIKKGEVIAWSGNTGSSAGPHLHFEIRNTKTEETLNPLFYISGLNDHSPPKIISVYVYPLDDKSYVNRSHENKRFITIQSQNGYRLSNDRIIEVFGKVGFGIQAVDYYNGTGMKLGIYSARLIFDGKPFFGFKMDNLSFDRSRYADSQADFAEREVNHRLVQRLFKQPGNRLNIYKPDVNSGVINVGDKKEHTIEIVVSDAFNNESRVIFKILSKYMGLPLKKIPASALKFDYDIQNKFENDKVKVLIPKGSLYDNLNFIYNYSEGPPGAYSKLQMIHNKTVPLNKPYVLSIKINNLPDNLKDKVLITEVDKASGKRYPIGGTYSGDWITANPDEFGNFTVMADTIPPTILPLSIQERKLLTDHSRIQFKIDDDLSGIKSYRGEIDAKWVLFEYEAKTKVISYTFDKKRMTFGKEHHLSLVVTDNRNNRSEYNASFFK